MLHYRVVSGVTGKVHAAGTVMMDLDETLAYAIEECNLRGRVWNGQTLDDGYVYLSSGKHMPPIRVEIWRAEETGSPDACSLCAGTGTITKGTTVKRVYHCRKCSGTG